MRLEFLPEARLDMLEAVDYYVSKKVFLGARSRNEIAMVLNHVVSAPTLWRERTGGYRRANCPVFPYYIAYFIRNEVVIVAAIVHGHRKPEFWKSRIRPS